MLSKGDRVTAKDSAFARRWGVVGEIGTVCYANGVDVLVEFSRDLPWPYSYYGRAPRRGLRFNEQDLVLACIFDV